MLRVAYVVGEFPSVSETFVLREMAALRPLGIDVEVFALRRPAPGPVHPDARAFLERTTYRPPALAPAALGTLARLACTRPSRVLAALRWVARPRPAAPAGCARRVRALLAAAAFARAAEARGVERVHAQFAFATSDVARLTARLLGRPFSVSVHARDLYTQADAALAARLRGAEFVAACTQAGSDRLAALRAAYGTPAPALIRHGLRLDRCPPAPGDSDLVLAVGRLEPKKGFEFLIEACRLLAASGAAFRCELVGEGPLRARLAAQIQAAGLGGRVALAGALAEEDVAARRQAAAIGVLPSVITPDGDRDGVPNALIEAMAAGLPVVSTRVGAIPELVADGENGFLVAPGDPAALADRIGRLLADPALRRRLGSRGRALAGKEFDISRNIAILARLFLSGQASRGPAAP